MGHNGKSLTSLTTLSDGMQPKSLPAPKSLSLKKAFLPPPDRLAIGYGSSVQSITIYPKILCFIDFISPYFSIIDIFPRLFPLIIQIARKS